MPDTRKGYKVPATVIPGHDSFPVVDSNDVAGNIMFFDSPDKLTTIPASKRKLGMFVYISNEGRHYKLINNKAVLDASCWEPYELVSKDYIDNVTSNFVTKESFEQIISSIPKTQSKSFAINENTTYPASFEIELPEGTSIVQINAIAEIDE